MDWSESDNPWFLLMSSTSHSSKLPFLDCFESSLLVDVDEFVILLRSKDSEFKSFNLNAPLSSLVSVDVYERLGDKGGWELTFSFAIFKKLRYF